MGSSLRLAVIALLFAIGTAEAQDRHSPAHQAVPELG